MTIPTSPVLPDQEVYFSFIIENTDKVRTVTNVRADLFNAPGFRTVAGTMCNSGANVCLPDTPPDCTNIRPCDLLPGEQRQIQYTLKAPSKVQIANIKTQARLDFKVLYDFHGEMNFVIPAINKEEVIRRQREGEKLDISFDKSFGAGPVRLDVQPLGVNYILDDLPTIMLFSVANVGSGNLMKSEISAYANSPIGGGKTSDQGIQMLFNPQLEVVQVPGDVITRIFGAPATTPEGDINYTNRIEKIQMYRDKSQISLRFPVQLRGPATTPGTPLNILKSNQIPFRSYEIKTKILYTYELRNYVDIVVNPFENT